MSRTYYYVKQILFYLFLTAYIALLAQALLFKEVSLFELFNADRTISRHLTLTPFKTIFAYFSGNNFNSWITLMNVAGNIVLFVPLGLYLQIFRKNKKLPNCVALTFAVSLCVEAVQYILGLGRADIDDIILNTLGGFLGVLVYRIIYSFFKDEDKTKTAVTFMFVLGTFVIVCFFVVINLLGFRIKIL